MFHGASHGSDLLDLVHDQVALITQNGGGLAVLLSQKIQPVSQSIHQSQSDGPEQPQDVQDLLQLLPVNCSDRRGDQNEQKIHERHRENQTITELVV